MSGSADQLANERLNDLRTAQAAHEEAKATFADAYVRYVRDALAAGWSWKRIATTSGLAEGSVRTFWVANRQRAGRLG